jgi:hypothetical protein
MMKKYLLALSLIVSVFLSSAQVIVQYDFTGYDGTVPSIAPGWYISHNDTGSFKTYYTTAATCGLSIPAYKFSVDSSEIISPAFSGATQVQFYLKGNGTANPYNTFHVYASPNGTNWNLVQSINPISASASTIVLPLSPSDVRVKFYYEKDSSGYNAGIDDIFISNGPVGVAQIDGVSPLTIYPTMSNGNIFIEEAGVGRNRIQVSVVNMIGKEVKKLDFVQLNGKTLVSLNDMPEGIYILKIKSTYGQLTKRIVIKK